MPFAMPPRWAPVDHSVVGVIPGYFISEEGVVKSEKGKQPRILQQYDGGDGRPSVSLRHNDRNYPTDVAVLLARAFLPRPDLQSATQVDHIDRNPLNNRLDNLRWATRTQQVINRAMPNSTGFQGVRLKHGRYFARHREVAVGMYATALEAGVAYARAVVLQHGEYATLELQRLAASDVQPVDLCPEKKHGVLLTASGQWRGLVAKRYLGLFDTKREAMLAVLRVKLELGAALDREQEELALEEQLLSYDESMMS